MANIIGCDISFYQDDNNTTRKVDFNQMKSNGASFVILRAGQNSWPDPDFNDYRRDAKAAGLPFGTYWFYDSRYEPNAQANLWTSILGSDTGDLPLFVDLEESYGGEYSGSSFWRLFIERLKYNFPNKEIFIYTAYYYWIENCPIADRGYFSQYPLWVANYGVSSPSIPPNWSNWTFWQYTSNGDGIAFGTESKSIDLNYFNGDLQSFKTRFNINGDTTPPPIEPPIVGDEQVGVVYTSALNIREFNSASSKSYGQFLKGQRITGVEVEPNENLRWVKISTPESYAGKYCAIGNDSLVYIQFGIPEQVEKHLTLTNGEYYKVKRFGCWTNVAITETSGRTFTVTPFSLRTTSNRALGYDADIAINGGDFNSSNAVGLASSEGVVYAKQEGYEPFLNLDVKQQASIMPYSSAGKLEVYNAVSGKRYIVKNGAIASDTSSAWYDRHPRTLVGVTGNGKLIQAVIDGRQFDYNGSWFEGIDLFDSARIMIEFGCVEAIDLDGGGSSTLYIKELGGVVNVPIDLWIIGKERPVGNNVLTFYDLDTTPIPPDTGGNVKKLVVNKDGTLFYRVVDGVVKGDDGHLNSGYELTFTDETTYQNGKWYTVIREPLPNAVKSINAIESRFLDVVDDTVTPPPTTGKKIVSATLHYDDDSTEELYPLS